MTDRLTTAVDALEQAPSPVRWEDVLRRVEEDAGVTLAPTDAGRAAASVGRTARLRRRAAVAAAVLVLVGVGVAWPRRDTHTSVTTRSGSTVPASTPTSAHGPTTLPAVSGRRYAAVVSWTGTEYVMWSGEGDSDGSGRADGWRYDPSTKRSRPIPVAPIAPRDSAAGVWTGTELIVCCGRSQRQGDAAYDTASAAAFDPSRGRWRRLADPPTPAGGYAVGAAWTGTQMLVVVQTGDPNAELGGHGMALFAYDPSADRWTTKATPTIGSRLDHVVWTGDRLVLWSSSAGGDRDGGIVYDPGPDAWRPLPELPRDHPTIGASIAYAGGQLVVWGLDQSDNTRAAGYRLRLGDTTWRPVAPAPLPTIQPYEGTRASQALATDPGSGRVVVWPVTGSESGAGGASTPPPFLLTYDPITDQWATVARMQQPRYAPQLTVGARSVFVPDANQPVLAHLAP